MTTSARFEFTDQAPTQVSVSVDAGLESKGRLLEHLAQGLQFPDYFGETWDGLIDCLSDLEWLDADEAIVDHPALPRLPPRDLRLYLECLHDALERRTPHDRPKLRACFRSKLKTAVDAALAGP